MKKSLLLTCNILFIACLFIPALLPAQATQQWVQRYNGRGYGDDVASASVLDASGNIYVTGSSVGSSTNKDYATIKYDASGNQVWEARYNGSGNGVDSARAIAVDASGNVYVTGFTTSSGTGKDYATIKYNSSGVQQWVSIYSGPSGSTADDIATSIVVDGSGNVFVTGISYDGTNPDCATIKYNAFGGQVLALTYNGPANSYDQGASIALDGSGNIYVLGTTETGSPQGLNFLTLKYNATGVQQWVNRYNGADYSEYGQGLVVDASGNVYVTGSSYEPNNGVNSWDIATVKYNTSGVQQWVTTYNGPANDADRPASIKLDNSGNVYITGNSIGIGSGKDYVTIKYNSTGVAQWIERFNGTGNGDDSPTSVDVDAAGNVYVTGTSYYGGVATDMDFLTLKYNTAGTLQWNQIHGNYGTDGGTSVKVDASGNVYAVGYFYDLNNNYNNTDYMVIKYNSAGAQQWDTQYNGPGFGADAASAMVVDAAGNVYVTGTTTPRASGKDIITIKYDAAGVQQWMQVYNGTGNGVDSARAIAVDASGNVYVTGFATGSSTGKDYAIIKYNSSGTQQWVSIYSGPSGSTADDYASSIVVDGSGNVFVTGISYDGTNPDCATIKYNSGGVQVWAVRYNGSANSYDQGASIALDASGNIYVAGTTETGPPQGLNFLILKYNATGVQQWVNTYNGANMSEYGKGLVVDASGNSYITGSSYEPNNGVDSYDIATVKYNPSGVQQWVTTYNGPANDDDIPASIKLDNSGNVYVTGSSIGNGSGKDYVTIKYNTTGVAQWIQRFNGAGNGDDSPTSVDVDAAGNVYVTGMSTIGSGNTDFRTLKYNPAGNQQWAISYNGPASTSDAAAAVGLDAAGNVYVTGGSAGNGTGDDFATIKYSQPLGINDIDNNLSLQLYPNPTSGIFTVVSDNANSNSTISITNTLGQTIMEQKVTAQKTKIDLSNQPSGIYFVTMSDGANGVVMQKVSKM